MWAAAPTVAVDGGFHGFSGPPEFSMELQNLAQQPAPSAAGDTGDMGDTET
jgi:hypothetical protein